MYRTVLLGLALAGAARAVEVPLKIEQAEALALENHPRIGEAAQLALAAGEVTREVRAAYFPVITFNITAVDALNKSRIAAGGLNNPVLFSRAADGVSMTQLVTDFGRTRKLTQSARLREEAARTGLWTAETEIALQADLAYFSLLRARALLTVAHQTVAARRTRAEQIGALAESKLRAGIDVTFADVQLSEARLFESRSENEALAAQARLAAALGTPERQYVLSEVPLHPPLAGDPQRWIGVALARRPDLVAARLEDEAAGRFASAEAALVNPTVSLAGVAGNVIEPENSPNLREDYRAIGVNVSVPVFNGGLFTARRREAEDRARAKHEQMRALEVAVVRDVKVAWLAEKTAFERLAVTRELLAHARELLDLADQRYENGLGSIVELGQAQLGLTTAEIEASTARYEYQTQAAILARQLGPPR